MAETLLLRAGPARIDAILLDAAISEQHTRELEATEHPVEEGAAITDHARLKPDGLTLDCLISNTPLSGEATPGRAEEAYEKLRLLQDEAKLVTVVTSLRVYEDMLLTSLSVPRTAKEAGAVHCTAVFKRILLVQNKTTVVSVPIEKKKTSGGKQAAKQASDAEQKKKSILKSGSDSIGLTHLLGL